MRVAHWTCRKCKAEKPRSDFYRDRSKAEGIRNECKDCTKAKLARYYDTHHEREIARGRYNYAKLTGRPVDEAVRVEFDGTICRRKRLAAFAQKHALRIDFGKFCSKCGEWKPTDQFQKSGGGGKRRSDCSACVKEYAAARYWADPDEFRRLAREWIAAHAEERAVAQKAKRDANPEPYRRRSLAYYYANREQQRANSKRWCVEHRDERREYVRQRYPIAKAKNPERFRNAGRRRRAAQRNASGVLTIEKVRQRMALYGNRCYLCGQGATAMDHVKPLSRGGSNWPSNLRPVCKSCNSRKHNTWPFPISAGPSLPMREVA